MLHYLHQPHFEAIVKDEVKANHLKEVPTHGIDGKRREEKGEGQRMREDEGGGEEEGGGRREGGGGRREEGERRRKREEGVKVQVNAAME